MQSSSRSRLCRISHGRNIKDEREDIRLGNFALDGSSHQTGDAAFTLATSKESQHSRANTNSHSPVKSPRRDTRALSPAGMIGGKAPLRLAAQKSRPHAPLAPTGSFHFGEDPLVNELSTFKSNNRELRLRFHFHKTKIILGCDGPLLFKCSL